MYAFGDVVVGIDDEDQIRHCNAFSGGFFQVGLFLFGEDYSIILCINVRCENDVSIYRVGSGNTVKIALISRRSKKTDDSCRLIAPLHNAHDARALGLRVR
jgi:hypothetical protein